MVKLQVPKTFLVKCIAQYMVDKFKLIVGNDSWKYELSLH